MQQYYLKTSRDGTDHAKRLGWENTNAQERRFLVLSEAINLDGLSVLDVGAGFADLAVFLRQKGFRVSYTGTEIFPDFAREARIQAGDSSIHEIDVLTRPDYFKHKSFDVVYASGPFNLKAHSSPESLEKAWDLFLGLARKAVVISLLHIRSPEAEEQYLYFDPAVLQEKFARQGWKLSIRDDYLPNDFALIARSQA